MKTTAYLRVSTIQQDLEKNKGEILKLANEKKLGNVDGKNITVSFIKISLASAVTGLISWFIIRGDMWTQGGKTIEKAGILTGIIALYIAVYIFIMHLLGSDELKYLVNLRKKKG